ncbi:hypothetical protein BKA62DRAFT_699455 [Auriculariales sp. MPI-PUGE-AT-0066]|nr:hypothetical protein BKA62DRAFT_699455 [Auriculariales sp. MPI-PUGE-AT-0066]
MNVDEHTSGFEDLRRDVEIHLSLQDEASRLRQALDKARFELEAAQRRHDGLALRLKLLDERIESIGDGINVKRRHVVQEKLLDFPPELLQQVFGATAAAFDIDQYFLEKVTDAAPGGDPSLSNRSRLPYRLRAVSRRWKAAADGTPALWSWIAVSDTSTWPSHIVSKIIDHIRKLTELSGNHGLDVYLQYCRDSSLDDEESDRDDDRRNDSRCYEKIFDILRNNISRIRSFVLDAPTNITIGAAIEERSALVDLAFDLLRSPTPNLQSLCLSFSGVLDEAGDSVTWSSIHAPRSLPTFLPHAPQLRKLSLHNAPFALSDRHPGLNSLESLWIERDRLEPYVVWDILRATPSLKELFLCLNSEISAQANSSDNRVPELSQLHKLAALGDGVQFILQQDTAPRLPRLAHFIGDRWSLGSDGLAQQLAGVIQHLELEDLRSIQPFHQSLALCNNIEQLTLRDCHMDTDATWMWPKLHCICFQRVEFEQEEEGIIRVINSRNASSSTIQDNLLGIRTVEADSKSLPRSIAAQIVDLLGERNVRYSLLSEL